MLLQAAAVGVEPAAVGGVVVQVIARQESGGSITPLAATFRGRRFNSPNDCIVSSAGSILFTGLVNPQAVRTAEMADIKAIVFVRGKEPPPETVELAREKGIPLVTTAYPMFEACGRLYEAGLRSCDISCHMLWKEE